MENIPTIGAPVTGFSSPRAVLAEVNNNTKDNIVKNFLSSNIAVVKEVASRAFTIIKNQKLENDGQQMRSRERKAFVAKWGVSLGNVSIIAEQDFEVKRTSAKGLHDEMLSIFEGFNRAMETWEHSRFSLDALAQSAFVEVHAAKAIKALKALGS